MIFGIVMASYPAERLAAVFSPNLSRRALVDWQSVLELHPKTSGRRRLRFVSNCSQGRTKGGIDQRPSPHRQE